MITKNKRLYKEVNSSKTEDLSDFPIYFLEDIPILRRSKALAEYLAFVIKTKATLLGI